ncbi:MAG: zinc metallopeptidase [Eubacteriaceae bacterium]|jgi:Zn-dependent membrane protease YugP|nr:zinc metallopeptidase [Eubacteriaceae bacterium]
MLYEVTLLILIPGILFSIFASIKVRTTYKKYSKIGNSKNITGRAAARRILDSAGLSNVKIEPVGGNLTDHYDPRAYVLRLSEGVYDSTSVAAIGIAAHEAGHAIQHARQYSPVVIRNAIVPVVNIATNASWIIFLIGLFFNNNTGWVLMNIGIFLFLGAVIFQIITLPVEYNASSRAVAELGSLNLGDGQDLKGVRKVLGAAALTYVAALLMALLQLFRLIALRGRR